MRFIYTFCLFIISPLILLRLFWRARKAPAYLQRIPERFGVYPFKLSQSIWVHAVSVGEVIAAVPLVKALKLAYPTLPIVVTTMTPTGSERVRVMLKDDIHHVYLPYDYPCAIRRFFKAMNPILGVIIETELWPNLLAAAKQNKIPMALLNARLSEQSAKGYARIGAITREMLQSLDVIAAASHSDKARFLRLGAEENKVHVTGNIKFDLSLAEDLPNKIIAWREMLGKNRYIWCAASTHQGEEEKVLAAHRLLCARYPDSLLILVPRHPDRFDEVAALCAASFKTARRSVNEVCEADTSVYLADTMGEVLTAYGASDAAFVGGSFVEKGGHNMLEPAALSKAILTGASLFNFSDISEMFLEKDAMLVVADENALAAILIRLHDDVKERERLGLAALSVMDANKGALAKQLALLRM